MSSEVFHALLKCQGTSAPGRSGPGACSREVTLGPHTPSHIWCLMTAHKDPTCSVLPRAASPLWMGRAAATEDTSIYSELVSEPLAVDSGHLAVDSRESCS